jgi:RES domain-containing protein
MPALYTSQRVETAWLEAQQGFPFKPQPLTICAYEVDCEDIVDLTEPGELARLAIAPADLSAPWEDLASKGKLPPSWAMARRLVADGAAGIVVPSLAPGAGGADVNVVFWRWSDRAPHLVQVIDDWDRLPKDDRSWPQALRGARGGGEAPGPLPSRPEIAGALRADGRIVRGDELAHSCVTC